MTSRSLLAREFSNSRSCRNTKRCRSTYSGQASRVWKSHTLMRSARYFPSAAPLDQDFSVRRSSQRRCLAVTRSTTAVHSPSDVSAIPKGVSASQNSSTSPSRVQSLRRAASCLASFRSLTCWCRLWLRSTVLLSGTEALMEASCVDDAPPAMAC